MFTIPLTLKLQFSAKSPLFIGITCFSGKTVAHIENRFITRHALTFGSLITVGLPAKNILLSLLPLYDIQKGVIRTETNAHCYFFYKG